MLFTPRRTPQIAPADADRFLAAQQRTVAWLELEIKTGKQRYKKLCDDIEAALDEGRMSEDALLAVAQDSRANASARALSIRLGEVKKSVTKKKDVLERKERLADKLARFIRQSHGVMRDHLTTHYAQTLIAKRGGLTEAERADKIFLGLTDVPPPSGGGGGGSGSGSGVKREREEDEAPAASAPAPPAPARVTASGKPDGRFKAGAK